MPIEVGISESFGEIGLTCIRIAGAQPIGLNKISLRETEVGWTLRPPSTEAIPFCRFPRSELEMLWFQKIRKSGNRIGFRLYFQSFIVCLSRYADKSKVADFSNNFNCVQTTNLLQDWMIFPCEFGVFPSMKATSPLEMVHDGDQFARNEAGLDSFSPFILYLPRKNSCHTGMTRIRPG
jgi:hypothetical protein